MNLLNEKLRNDFYDVIESYRTGTTDLLSTENLALAYGRGQTGESIISVINFSNEIVEYDKNKCNGCGECEVFCPHGAIKIRISDMKRVIALADGLDERVKESFAHIRDDRFVRYHDTIKDHMLEEEDMVYSVIVDPDGCTGCLICVQECAPGALAKASKTAANMRLAEHHVELVNRLVEDEGANYLGLRLMDREKRPLDATWNPQVFMKTHSACPGCGETPYVKLALQVLAAEGYEVSLFQATGCVSVVAHNTPNAIYSAKTSSHNHFGDAPAIAEGYGLGLEILGEKKSQAVVSVVGDGALDVGWHHFSEAINANANIIILVLDNLGYANTGFQVSSATPAGMSTSLAKSGTATKGKSRVEKDIPMQAINMGAYVARCNIANPTHFARSILEANAYEGTGVVHVYVPCPTSHKTEPRISITRARDMMDSRMSPIFRWHPDKGLNLEGNLYCHTDFVTRLVNEKPAEFRPLDFLKNEKLFRQHFQNEHGLPSNQVIALQDRVIANWRKLQELAGMVREEQE